MIPFRPDFPTLANTSQEESRGGFDLTKVVRHDGPCGERAGEMVFRLDVERNIRARPSAVSAKETTSLCSPASQGEQRAGAGSVGMRAKSGTADHRRRQYLCAALITLLALLGDLAPVDEEGLWGIVSSPERVRAFLEGFGALALTILFLLQAAQFVSLLPGAPLRLPELPPSVRGQASHSPSRAPCRDRSWPFLLEQRFGRPMVADLVGEKALESRAGTIGGAEG